MRFHTYYYPLLLLCACLFVNCQETAADEQVYSISGKIDQAIEDGLVILSAFDPITQKRTAIDTSRIASDGSYKLQFEWVEPDLFRLDFFRKQTVMLIIDEGQRGIELNVEGVRKGRIEVKGSEDAQKLLAYEDFRQASYDRIVKPTYDAMRAATKAGDEQGEIDAVDAYAHASEESRRELITYTFEHIGTSVALYGTMLRWTGDEEIDKLEKLVADFEAMHPDLQMTKVMVDKVARFKRVALGVKAPEISEANPEGELTSLYELKGSYTLLDFWASWCRPCLLQIPDLKQAYDQFHEQGFEIVGVSVDDRGEDWKKAIASYEMNWIHLSDLKGWASQAAADYNVTFVPFNVLIDSEGTIIAKNLHSKSLNRKLEELLSISH